MKDQLKDAMKEAMRAKEKVRLATIRSIISAIQYEELQQGVEDLAEDKILAVLKNEAKKRQETIELSEQAGRDDEIETLNVELAVINEFLPQQLSEDEIRSILGNAKDTNPDFNMGQAMKLLKEEHFGRYDGKVASQLAREIFG